MTDELDIQGDAPDEGEAAAPAAPAAPRGSRSSLATLLIVAAVGLNLAGLAVVTVIVSSTRHELERRIDDEVERAGAPSATAVPAEAPTEADDLMGIALRLEEMGQIDNARRVRGAAQALLLQKHGDEGALELAELLLARGRTREARRAYYRILARGDRPGEAWARIVERARFRIADTLSEEAERQEELVGGDS
jgi:hypothetical protein